MNRDMDLVRKILLAMESISDEVPLNLKIEGYDLTTVQYHMHLMNEAGLVEGFEASVVTDPVRLFRARHITWDGHEFLAAARVDTIWAKARAGAAAATLFALKTALGALAVSETKSKLGLP